MTQDTLQLVPIAKIKPAPDNVRSDLGDLEGLAASIKEQGVVQVITVEPNGDGYTVVDGHRRLAAAVLAGFKELQVVVRDKTDAATRTAAMIVANLQRLDVPPIDEANGFQRLLDLTGKSQGDVAKMIGCTQPHVSKRLSLLRLPEPVQKRINAGGIPLSAAVGLARIADDRELVTKVLEDSMRGGGRANPKRTLDVEELEWQVREAVERREQDERYAQAVAEETASKAPVPVLAWERGSGGNWKMPTGSKRVTTEAYTYDPHVHMRPSTHAKQPCHAFTVDPRSMQATAICTQPKRHEPKPDRPATPKGPTESQLEKQRREREREEAKAHALEEAAERRQEFLERFITKGRKVDQTQLLLGGLALVAGWLNDGRQPLKLLGIEKDDKAIPPNRRQEALAEFAARGDREAMAVGVAVALSVYEDDLQDLGWLGKGSGAPQGQLETYLRVLERSGYELSDVERETFGVKAAKP